MAKKFTSHAVLTKGGKLFGHGDIIELTDEEAKRLGDKVGEYEEPTKEDFIEGGAHDEVSFRKLPAEDQKAVVEGFGGDLSEITNADARWEFVASQQ